MANGNYGNEPSQTRWMIAALAGVVAFLLSRFALHQGFWLPLVIGIVVFVIVLLLWSLFGAKSDPGYGGSTGSATSGSGSTAPVAASPAASSASAASPVMAETSARDAAVSSGSSMVAPAPLMSSATPAAPVSKAVEPAAKVAAKAEKAPKVAAKAAATPVVTKAAAKPAAVKAVAAPKAAKAVVVKAEAAAKSVATPAAPKAPKAVAAPKVAAPKAAAKAATPEVLKAPRGGKADDLKIIEGIGPVLEKLVNSFGVYHFDQIAKWSAKDIAFFDAKMDRFTGRITRDKWVAQAKIIGKEGVEAFLERAKTNNY